MSHIQEHECIQPYLTFRNPCIVIYILVLKVEEMHCFSNLFDTLHVSENSTVHHQEYLNTVYT